MNTVRTVFSAIAFVLVPQLAWSLDITPAKDSSIFKDVANNSAGAGLGIFAGNNNNKSPRRGLIQFDVAGNVPTGVTITGATLTLTLEQSPGVGPSTIDLHRLSVDWGEGNKSAGSLSGMGAAAGAGDATWNENMFGSSSWTNAGGDYAGAISAGASVGSTLGQQYIFSSPTLLNEVIDMYLNPGNNHGWELVNEGEGVNDQQTVKSFYSREATPIGLRPVLSITFVPEPGSVSLALLACPLWLGCRRRNWAIAKRDAGRCAA
jgi:hypothetical protein